MKAVLRAPALYHTPAAGISSKSTASSASWTGTFRLPAPTAAHRSYLRLGVGPVHRPLLHRVVPGTPCG